MPPYEPPKRASNGGVPYLLYINPVIAGCGIASVQVLARILIPRASVHGGTVRLRIKKIHTFISKF